MKPEAVLRGAPGLSVACMAPGGEARWDEFVRGCPQATFFHLSPWAGILEEVFGFRTYFLYAARGNRIEGVLPLALVDSWLTGRALVSLPLCIEAGVAAISPQAHGALLAEAGVIARQLKVGHLEVRSRQQQMEGWPSQDLYVRFEKPILEDDEANMAAIPRKQRAMVRKGVAGGLRAECEADLAGFYALYADNMRRHGSPAQSRAFFSRLLQAFGEEAQILTVRSPRGEALSSVLSFYFRDTVLPYYAGDVEHARDFHANDFKYWALMCEARARGCKVFDYGRSKRGSGSFAFKKNWGCEPQPLHYQYQFFAGQSGVPQHNPNNPKYRLLIAAWRRLPLPITTLLGPMVAKHFV